MTMAPYGNCNFKLRSVKIFAHYKDVGRRALSGRVTCISSDAVAQLSQHVAFPLRLTAPLPSQALRSSLRLAILFDGQSNLQHDQPRSNYSTPNDSQMPCTGLSCARTSSLWPTPMNFQKHPNWRPYRRKPMHGLL